MSGRLDMSTSHTGCYGLCSVVASCSCHRLHGGSWCLCLRRVVLWVALWDRRRPVSVSPNIWHQFSTVLWLNNVPFNSLIYGYAYPKQIFTFHNNLWRSECTGIECINLHLCIHMHMYMSNCSSQVVHHNYCTCSATASMQKEPCASSSRSSRYHLQWCVTAAHVWVEAIPIL